MQILLDHLWAELGPLEFVRVFKTLHEFYNKFHRQHSKDFVSYDTAFRTQLRLLDEVGAGLEGLTKGYWYLAKAGINDDLRQKVVLAGPATSMNVCGMRYQPLDLQSGGGRRQRRQWTLPPLEGPPERSSSQHGRGRQLQW